MPVSRVLDGDLAEAECGVGAETGTFRQSQQTPEGLCIGAVRVGGVVDGADEARNQGVRALQDVALAANVGDPDGRDAQVGQQARARCGSCDGRLWEW